MNGVFKGPAGARPWLGVCHEIEKGAEKKDEKKRRRKDAGNLGRSITAE